MALIPGEFALGGTGLYRATAGFGWPNELGMFLAISLPFGVYVYRSSRSAPGRLLGILAIAAIGVGLLATFSRGSWIATLVAPGILLFTGERGLALRFWGVVLVGVVAFDLGTGGLLTDRVLAAFTDPLVGQRFALTQAGILMFLAHPWVGVGPGGFGDSLDQFGLQVSGLFDFVGSAHNTYVHMAAEAGIIGLLALVAFLGSTLWAMVRQRRGGPHPSSNTDDTALRTAVLWSFTVACTVAFAEWAFAHGVGQLIMLVAAMGCAGLARDESVV